MQEEETMNRQCPLCPDTLPSIYALHLHLAQRHNRYEDGQDVEAKTMRQIEKVEEGPQAPHRAPRDAQPEELAALGEVPAISLKDAHPCLRRGAQGLDGQQTGRRAQGR